MQDEASMASVYYRAWEAGFGAIMFAIQKPQAPLQILQAAAALLAVVLTCSTPAAAAGDVKASHEARTLKITVPTSPVMPIWGAANGATRRWSRWMGTRISTTRLMTAARAGL